MSAEPESISVEWIGHSCFLFSLSNGARILIDPFEAGKMPYSLPQESVDLVFSTHDHFDHNAVAAVPAKLILRADGRQATFFGSKSGFQVNDQQYTVDLRGATLTCTTVPSYHDSQQGKQRGVNGIIRFTAAGITFVHCGDLGCGLSAEQIAQLTPVDVLFIPIGGYYTINAKTAQQIVRQLEPRLVIPMHYKTAALGDGFPIGTEAEFLRGFDHVRRESNSKLNVTANSLPEMMTIIVLKYHAQK